MGDQHCYKKFPIIVLVAMAYENVFKIYSFSHFAVLGKFLSKGCFLSVFDGWNEKELKVCPKFFSPLFRGLMIFYKGDAKWSDAYKEMKDRGFRKRKTRKIMQFSGSSTQKEKQCILIMFLSSWCTAPKCTFWGCSCSGSEEQDSSSWIYSRIWRQWYRWGLAGKVE